MSRRTRARTQAAQAREGGWDLSSCRTATMPSYNALYDPNMRHYFENTTIQSHLYKTGQIDKSGRVIDLERNKSKLNIIEREFKVAEKTEYWRQKEEEEMRYRVQQKRHAALDRARAQEKLMKMKEDRQIRQEIVSATRESYGIRYPAVERKKFRSKGSRSLKSGGATSLGSAPENGSSFFITDGDM